MGDQRERFPKFLLLPGLLWTSFASLLLGCMTTDTTAPGNGVIGITMASGVSTLAWSGFLDEGLGIGSYTLVSSARALADGSRGTLIHAGLKRSFKTAKLPTGMTCLRVCANDSAGHVDAGVTTSLKVTGSSCLGNGEIPYGFAAVSHRIKRG